MAERKADGALADGNIDSVKQAGRLAFENLGGGGRNVKWFCSHPEGSVQLSPGVLLCFLCGFGVGRLRSVLGALHRGLVPVGVWEPGAWVGTTVQRGFSCWV